MLIDTKILIQNLEDYLEANPEPDYDNDQLRIIIHVENKLIRKAIRYLKTLGE